MFKKGILAFCLIGSMPFIGAEDLSDESVQGSFDRETINVEKLQTCANDEKEYEALKKEMQDLLAQTKVLEGQLQKVEEQNSAYQPEGAAEHLLIKRLAGIEKRLEQMQRNMDQQKACQFSNLAANYGTERSTYQYEQSPSYVQNSNYARETYYEPSNSPVVYPSRTTYQYEQSPNYVQNANYSRRVYYEPSNSRWDNSQQTVISEYEPVGYDSSRGYYSSEYSDSCCMPCWDVGAEFLYWTVEEGTLAYVTSGAAATIPNGAGPFGTFHHATNQWNPGFRIYLGYTFDVDCGDCCNPCCDQWEIMGRYTRFTTSGSDSIDLPTDGTLLIGTLPQAVAFITRASTHIKFHYQLGELLLARHFALSNCLSACLQTGLVGGCISQDWAVTYLGVPAGGNPVSEDDLDLHWKFSGGGLKIGGNFDWKIGCGLGLFAEINASVLFGQYKNQITENAFLPTGALFATRIDGFNQENRIVESLQIALGPTWASCLCGWNFNIYALYELNTWGNLHEYYLSVPSTFPQEGRDLRYDHGFLAVHGLTLGIDVTF